MNQHADDDEVVEEDSTVPKYKVLEIAYIDGELVGPGQHKNIVFFDGIPGPHLKPMNDAAKAMCEKHKKLMAPFDPVGDLSIVSASPEKLKK